MNKIVLMHLIVNQFILEGSRSMPRLYSQRIALLCAIILIEVLTRIDLTEILHPYC